ncbi:hypothetical protein LINPERPRIM_LOCUS14181 [Linum perenne]
MNITDAQLVRRLAVALLLMLLATNGVLQSADSCRHNIMKSHPRNGKPHLATTNNIGSSSGRYQAPPPHAKSNQSPPPIQACSSFSPPGGHG